MWGVALVVALSLGAVAFLAFLAYYDHQAGLARTARDEEELADYLKQLHQLRGKW
jgi:hypothetical protein